MTAGYALALVASGLTALETGRRSQVLAVVWLRGLANDAAMTILLGGYAQSGVPVVPVK